MAADLTLEDMRALAAEMLESTPGLQVVEEEPRDDWKATRIHYWPTGASEPAATVVSGSGALDVHFGTNLVFESGARTAEEAMESVDIARNLITSISREGFVERLWLRGEDVIAAEAEITLGASAQRFKWRTMRPLRTAHPVVKPHRPW